jgi:hypothetical protein
MNKFRKLGFIDYNGHLELHGSLLSVVLNDQPHMGHADFGEFCRDGCVTSFERFHVTRFRPQTWSKSVNPRCVM